jgi:hypothetical protein
MMRTGHAALARSGLTTCPPAAAGAYGGRVGR